MLWHMHSDILDGFYAAEVYVSAETKDQAVQLGLDAYDAWLENEIKEYFCDPLTWSNPEDDDYASQAKANRETFLLELQTELQPVPNNAMIFRRT